jgi:hypothetical protein
VFFDPLPLVMGLLFAALMVRTLIVHEVQSVRFARHTLFIVLGFLATYAAVEILESRDFDSSATAHRWMDLKAITVGELSRT